MFNALSTNYALRALITLLSTLLLTACGGGGSSPAPAPTLESLALVAPSTKLKAGEAFQSAVSGTYSDTTTADLSTEASWASDDVRIFTVSSNGLITAIGAGSATLSSAYAGQTTSTRIEVIELSSLSLLSPSTKLERNDTFQASLTGNYSDASSLNLSDEAIWLSDNTDIFTVSSSGLITATGAGTATLSVSHSGETASTSIEVFELSSLSLSSPSVKLKVGESFQSRATGLYSDASTSDLSAVTSWASSNNDTFNVSNTGLVTATGAGTATLSATYLGKSANTNIEVIELSTLTMSTIPNTLEVGDTLQLSAIGTYSDTSNEDLSSDVSWSSSNSIAISVSSSGLLSINSAGSATISISYDGLNDQQNLEIVVLNELSISSLPSAIEVNETYQLSASAQYSDGSSSDVTTQAVWSSSDNSILSVSTTGLVSSVAPGVATITASFDGQSATSNAQAYALDSISLTPATLTLALASSQSLTATGIYTNSTTADLSASVTWQSSDDDVATINTSGLVNALSAGSTNITATIGSISGSIQVSVSPATLQSISINIPDTLVAGLSTKLSATGTYSDGSTQDITNELNWTSSHNTIASIDSETHTINAIQAGNIQVFASKGSNSSQASITISPAQIESIVLTPPLISIAKGTQNEVHVTAIFTDKSHLDITNQVSWTSSDSAVAAISPDEQNVMALDLGTATLTAEIDSHSATSSITVSDAILTEIKVLPINSDLPKGLTRQYSAQGTYSDGSVQDISTQVIWSSSDSAISSISNADISTGLASALTLGQTNITATLGSISKTTSLTIQDAVLTALEIQPGTLTIAKGLAVQATAIGSYSDGEQINLSREVSWNSNNTSVSSIENADSPVIRANTEGEALITVELEGISGISLITVTSATLQSISLSSESTAIPKGFTQQVRANGLYTDSSSQDITHLVTWQSSDNDILTVDNNENSPGLIRTVSQGSSTVSASFEGRLSTEAFTVSDAQLSSIAISSPSTNMNVNTVMQLSAIANYSDSSTKDVTHEVNWSSSSEAFASIESPSDDYFSNQSGLVNALSEGSTDISAFLLNSAGEIITSNTLSISISEDPNASKALSLTLSPNVILNDNTDSSTVSAKLSPNASSGAIPDNTEVTFTIIDNGISRNETAFTTNGVAEISISSANKGIISISASSGQIGSTTALYSTDDFADIILIQAQAQANYDSETSTLLKDSALLTLVRNLSNRELSFVAVAVLSELASSNVTTPLPGSPFDINSLTDDPVLSGGEFTVFGFVLDEDRVGNNFYIIYLLRDNKTSHDFTPGVGFTFE